MNCKENRVLTKKNFVTKNPGPHVGLELVPNKDACIFY